MRKRSPRISYHADYVAGATAAPAFAGPGQVEICDGRNIGAAAQWLYHAPRGSRRHPVIGPQSVIQMLPIVPTQT